MSKNQTLMIKEMVLLTIFMVMNILVITGILLQTEQDLREKSKNPERIFLQSDESEKRDIMRALRGKTGRNSNSPFEYNF